MEPARSWMAPTLPFHAYSLPLWNPSAPTYHAALRVRSLTVRETDTDLARNDSGSDRLVLPDFFAALEGFFAGRAFFFAFAICLSMPGTWLCRRRQSGRSGCP